jgi:hypothetical protein
LTNPRNKELIQPSFRCFAVKRGKEKFLAVILSRSGAKSPLFLFGATLLSTSDLKNVYAFSGGCGDFSPPFYLAASCYGKGQNNHPSSQYVVICSMGAYAGARRTVKPE